MGKTFYLVVGAVLWGVFTGNVIPTGMSVLRGLVIGTASLIGIYLIAKGVCTPGAKDGCKGEGEGRTGK